MPDTILAMETSCDETAVAILRFDGKKVDILTSKISSQINLHRKFQGVVPELASRNHSLTLRPLVELALKNASLTISDIDAFAATAGPGLASSLLVGNTTAKALALGRRKPFLSVNHMEGHMLSPFLDQEKLEANLALIVSGGHTLLIHMKAFGDYKLLGSTRDDAAGEAFDKVGKMLGLPYPGGPEIEKAARRGSPKAFDFPRSMIKDGLDFSFSGLKTAVLYQLEKLDPKTGRAPADAIPDLCASFQQAVIDVLITKTLRATAHSEENLVTLSGGVSCNQALREAMQKACDEKNLRLLIAPPCPLHRQRRDDCLCRHAPTPRRPIQQSQRGHRSELETCVGNLTITTSVLVERSVFAMNMKILFHLLIFSFLLSAIFLATGCGSSGSSSYSPPPKKIKVMQDNRTPLLAKNRAYTLKYSKSIKDVDIFELRRNVLQFNESSSVDSQRRKYSYAEGADGDGDGNRRAAPMNYKHFYNKAGRHVVNLMFMKHGAKRKLFGEDKLILNTRYARYLTAEERNKPLEERHTRSFKKNLYQVISRDGDKDGDYDRNDGIDLYVTNYDGSGRRRLVRNFKQYYFPRDEEIIIETRSSKEVVFWKYNALRASLIRMTSLNVEQFRRR